MNDLRGPDGRVAVGPDGRELVGQDYRPLDYRDAERSRAGLDRGEAPRHGDLAWWRQRAEELGAQLAALAPILPVSFGSREPLRPPAPGTPERRAWLLAVREWVEAELAGL